MRGRVSGWWFLAQIFHAGSLRRPEHDPERDQQGNGVPVSRAHSGAGLMEPMDLSLPFLHLAMKESYSNPDVSSAETFLLFIKPLACSVGCSSRAMVRSPCGH